MRLGRVEYLRWAKALPPCRLRLSDSGVPDVGPNEFLIDASCIRLDEQNPYGLPELIEALAHRYRVNPERVLPVAGASGANFIALGALLERGDEVLLESPGYEPIERAVDFLELRVRRLRREPDRRFRFDLDEVESALRQGARALVLTDLHNPSGLRTPPQDLDVLADLTARHGAHLIVDEVYLEYAAVNLGQDAPPAARLGEHVVTANSLTKVYGLGRLRAGWLIASAPVIEKARDLLDHVCVVNPTPSEQLAVDALSRLDVLTARTRTLFQRGRAVLSDWLSTRVDVEPFGNDGAVFEFPRIRGVGDTRELCETLARDFDTLAVPGAFFGAPAHIRLSFCRPPEIVAEGLARLGSALDHIQRRR